MVIDTSCLFIVHQIFQLEVRSSWKKMYNIEVHNRIQQIISVFYFTGLWHDQNRTKFIKFILSVWHLALYAYYPISLIGGALSSANNMERIFLGVMSIIALVSAVKLYYFILKMDTIHQLIRKMGVHSLENKEEFNRVSFRINVFIKFISYFEVTLLCAVMTLIIIALPLFSNEKRFPLNIYFPLDWENNEFYYWITYAFVAYELLMCVVSTFSNVIIWYLMMACVTECEILGNEFKNLGLATAETDSKISISEKQKLFLKQLIQLIKKHQNLKAYE